VLDALLEVRPDTPYSCREGVCATCRALVLSGEVVMTRSSGLDERERRAGQILACQAHPVTPRVMLTFDFDQA
jgi:ring-1,2-phenylacetyl-CoA epoxidase subunit PaaE